jgi:hypothetical protein
MLRTALLLAVVACGRGEAPTKPPPTTTTPAPATLDAARTPEGLAGWPVPPGWRSEVIPFPLDFAPALAHRGYEDLRFPPGMFDPAAPGYWSYVFVWRTDDDARLDAKALGDELTQYFRGLIAAVDDKRRITARDQIVATAAPDGARFALTAHVFDAFKTAQPIDLTGWAERRACATGALWIFVLAREGSPIRAELDALGRAAQC